MASEDDAPRQRLSQLRMAISNSQSMQWLSEWKWPLGLGVIGIFNLWGLLKWLWNLIGIADNLVFLAEQLDRFSVVTAFIESGTGLILIGAACFWTAVKFSQLQRITYAVISGLLAIVLFFYVGFSVGQQAPPPEVQLRYFNPMEPLKASNDPLRIIAELNTLGLRQYGSSHFVAIRCRAVTAGVPFIAAPNVQLSRFYPITEETVIELLPGDRMTEELCAAGANSQFQCNVIMVRKSAAKAFNVAVNAYRADIDDPPMVDRENIDYLSNWSVKFPVKTTGCGE